MTATLKNIMKHIVMEIDEENNSIIFSWDDEDKKVDKIMTNDFRGDINRMTKKSLLWIEEIKKVSK
jgi:hypothetical protein